MTPAAPCKVRRRFAPTCRRASRCSTTSSSRCSTSCAASTALRSTTRASRAHMSSRCCSSTRTARCASRTCTTRLLSSIEVPVLLILVCETAVECPLCNRVPRNTHVPPTLPGVLSTAGHSDQSRMAISSSSFLRDSCIAGSSEPTGPLEGPLSTLAVVHSPRNQSMKSFESAVQFAATRCRGLLRLDACNGGDRTPVVAQSERGPTPCRILPLARQTDVTIGCAENGPSGFEQRYVLFLPAESPDGNDGAERCRSQQHGDRPCCSVESKPAPSHCVETVDRPPRRHEKTGLLQPRRKHEGRNPGAAQHYEQQHRHHSETAGGRGRAADRSQQQSEAGIEKAESDRDADESRDVAFHAHSEDKRADQVDRTQHEETDDRRRQRARRKEFGGFERRRAQPRPEPAIAEEQQQHARFDPGEQNELDRHPGKRVCVSVVAHTAARDQRFGVDGVGNRQSES